VQAPGWAPKVAAGWHLCLVVLDQLLAGEPIGPIVGQEAMRFDWQDLHDRYAMSFGEMDGRMGNTTTNPT